MVSAFRPVTLALFLLLFVAGAPAAAQPGAPGVRLPKNALKNLDADIERLRKAWNVPGLAVAVVTNDRVVFAKGFGQRDVGTGQPVTANTLFGIASCSKALGAATVCLLAQEGRLDLDAPVRDAWPAFRLADDYATLHVTPRDLLSHRTGLPRHDLVWYHAPGLRRGELVRRLQYLTPAADARAAFHYSNLGYTALSALVAEVVPDHASWEEVTRRRLLDPLGMTRTNFSVHDSQRDADHALPYRLRPTTPTGPPERLPLQDVDAIGAAANINSTAADMARWLRATLTDGHLDGKQIIPAEALHLTHEPQMTYDLPAPDDDVYTDTYGMGWVIGTYRGFRYMTHSGSLDGFTSEMAVLPNDGVGVIVMANLDDTELPHLLANTLLDRLTGLPAIDWSARYRAYTDDDDDLTRIQDSIPDPFRVSGTRPAHPLAAYAGRYFHPAYGTLTLRATPEGQLRGDLHGLGLALAHYHYETFATDAAELLPNIGPEQTGPATLAPPDPVPVRGLHFTFTTDARGEVSALSAALEPDAREPIRFARQPDTVRVSRAQLRRFAGVYGPSPREAFRVELRESSDTLRIRLKGEPALPLVPVRPTEFIVPGLPGYLLRFVLPTNGPPDQPATEVLTIQPDGVFRDRRRAE